MAKAKKPQENKPETVAEIRAKAAKVQADPAKFKRAGRRTDAAVRSETFEWNRSKSTVDGLDVHYFRVKFENVTGILCAPNFELWKGVTYKMLVDRIEIPGHGVREFDPAAPLELRLPGNRMLNRIIKDADCLYQRVTITYEGKRFKTSRHFEKVYRIEPAPLGKDGVGPAGRKVIQQAAAEAGKKKAAAQKGGIDEL